MKTLAEEGLPPADDPVWAPHYGETVLLVPKGGLEIDLGSDVDRLMRILAAPALRSQLLARLREMGDEGTELIRELAALAAATQIQRRDTHADH